MAPLNIANPNFTYDGDDPEGFRAERVCPYHYEYGEEEWLMVLSGRPWLRTPEGTATGSASGRVSRGRT